MNKKNKVKLIIVIIMSLVIITWNKSYSYEMNNNEVEEKEIESKEFAIYLEKTQNTKDYEESENKDFPNQGYLLNKEKTKCYEYGSDKEVTDAVGQSLSSGVIDGSIIVTSQKSIYCNIYFDKDEDKPEVSEFTLTGSENGTTLSNNKLYTHTTNVTYNVTWTNEDVAQICISEGKTCSNWQEVESNSKTKNGIITISTGEGEKTIYVYLKDKANNTSVEKSLTITLDTNAPTIILGEATVTEDSIEIGVTVTDTIGVQEVKCKAIKDKNEVTGNYENNTCTFSGLEAGTEYTITIEATDGSGRKNTSNELSITTLKKELSRDEIIQKYFNGTVPGGLSTKILGDMYRFVGKTANVSNYICFGYSNLETDCNNKTSDYMYRIIGITEDGQMKLIKNTAIREESAYQYKWYENKTTNVTWPNSYIYKRLNGLSNGLTSGTDGDTNLFIDSTTSNVKYIKTEGDTAWYSKIDSNHQWLYGGINNVGMNNSADYVYKIESGQQETVQYRNEDPSKWTSSVPAAIGLMYVSDFYYSYASSGTNSKDTNCYFSTSGCDNSWLYMGNNGENIHDYQYEWTMTRNGQSYEGSNYGWRVNRDGEMLLASLDEDHLIRPVFYLLPTIEISDGHGTSGDPFIITN